MLLPGKRDMNVTTAKRNSDSQNLLFGIPKESATLWWRIAFWQDAMKRHNVPEHVRPAGMYCPLCGKRQPLSDQCAFCKCDFPCFVIVRANMASNLKRLPKGTNSTDTAKHGICDRLFAPLHAVFSQIGKASLRIKAVTICVMILLSVSLVLGISHYRSDLQKQYSQRFVVALYGIKSGITMSGMVCEGKYKTWKEGTPLNSSSSSEIDSQTIADLVAVKTEVDGIMGKLGAASAKNDQSLRTLLRIYAIYDKLNSMIINSPDSLSLHKTEIATAGDDFAREIKVLKANLPASLAEEFKIFSKKYDLQFMASGK